VKIASASGAPPPDPRVVVSAYYYNFVEFMSNAECVLLPSKKNKITTVNVRFLLLSHLSRIFHFKLCTFFDRGRKNISCPRAQGTLATPAEEFVRQSDWRHHGEGDY